MDRSIQAKELSLLPYSSSTPVGRSNSHGCAFGFTISSVLNTIHKLISNTIQRIRRSLFERSCIPVEVATQLLNQQIFQAEHSTALKAQLGQATNALEKQMDVTAEQARKIRELQAALHQKSEKLTRTETCLNELETELLKEKETLKETAAHSGAMRTKLETQAHTIYKQRTEFTQLEAEFSKIFEQLQSRLDQTSGKLDQADKQLDLVKTHHQLRLTSLQEEITRLTSQLNKSSDDLKSAKQQLVKEMEDRNTEKQNATNIISELSNKLDEYQKLLESITQELDIHKQALAGSERCNQLNELKINELLEGQQALAEYIDIEHRYVEEQAQVIQSQETELREQAEITQIHRDYVDEMSDVFHTHLDYVQHCISQLPSSNKKMHAQDDTTASAKHFRQTPQSSDYQLAFGIDDLSDTESESGLD